MIPASMVIVIVGYRIAIGYVMCMKRKNYCSDPPWSTAYLNKQILRFFFFFESSSSFLLVVTTYQLATAL